MLSILMITGGILLRLTPHVPNFAPITAVALFGGAYLGKKYALLIPFLAMIVSDYLLLYINPFETPALNLSLIQPVNLMFHSTTLFVWGSFLISGLIGVWLRKHKKPMFIIAASFFASIQFFIITNFGVWATGMYSRGLDGLLESYIMGLVFFKWTMIGDLFYTTVFFGTYKLAQIIPNKSVSLMNYPSAKLLGILRKVLL